MIIETKRTGHQQTDRESIMTGWHLNKGVSVTHIITTVTAVIAIMMVVTDMDKRISITEVIVEAMKADDVITAAEIDNVRQEIKNGNRDIMTKLEAMDARQYQHLERHNQ